MFSHTYCLKLAHFEKRHKRVRFEGSYACITLVVSIQVSECLGRDMNSVQNAKGIIYRLSYNRLYNWAGNYKKSMEDYTVSEELYRVKMIRSTIV